MKRTTTSKALRPQQPKKATVSLDSLQKQIEELKKEIKTIEEIKTQIQTLTTQNESFTQQLQEKAGVKDLSKQISDLQNEIKTQNETILKEQKLHKEEIEQLKKQVSNIISQLSENSPHYMKEISQHLIVKELHSDWVISLLELSDKRIVAGSYDGMISINSIHYSSKMSIQHVKKTAHKSAVQSLCEISNKRLVSASDDTTIKIWDCSQLDDLNHIRTINGHNGQVWKVIPLTNERFASCSPFDNTVKLWNCNTYGQIFTPFEHQGLPFSIIQLKKQKEVIVICSREETRCLNFFNLCAPFDKEGTIHGVYTNHCNGLVELSNGYIAASRGVEGNKNDYNCIFIADPVKYLKIAEIIDKNYIIGASGLCCFGNGGFLYAHCNIFCQIVVIKGEYRVIYSKKTDLQNLYGKQCLISVYNVQDLINQNESGGFNVFSFVL